MTKIMWRLRSNLLRTLNQMSLFTPYIPFFFSSYYGYWKHCFRGKLDSWRYKLILFLMKGIIDHFIVSINFSSNFLQSVLHISSCSSYLSYIGVFVGCQRFSQCWTRIDLCWNHSPLSWQGTTMAYFQCT